MSYGWPRHPDEDSSGFHPSLGWCAECGAVIRLCATRWYGNTSSTPGPYCSSECLSGAFQRGGVDPHPQYIGHCLRCGRDDAIGPDRLGEFTVCYECLATERTFTASGSLPTSEPATVQLSPPLRWVEGRNQSDSEGGPRLLAQSSDARVVDALLPL